MSTTASTPRRRPTNWAIAEHWAASPERGMFAPRMHDVGEPCCFACGWWSVHWDKGTARESWNRAALQGAHIVGRQFGGGDSTDNMILLCAPCHEDSPDWPEPSAMAAWLKDCPPRQSVEREQVVAWLDAVATVPEFAAIVEQDGFSDRVTASVMQSAEKAGMHFGVGISRGTRVAILRDAAASFTA